LEKPAFMRACLFDVRVNIVIMHVPLVELICHVAMGPVPALQYLLPSVHEARVHGISFLTINVVAS
jgi:hypothetical protein